MIDLRKLQSNVNADILQMLEFIKNDANISIGAIQETCEMGYARVARYIDLFLEVGILNPRKYCVVKGNDGKKHRKYLPYKLAVSTDELQSCIDELKTTNGGKDNVGLQS